MSAMPVLTRVCAVLCVAVIAALLGAASQSRFARAEGMCERGEDSIEVLSFSAKNKQLAVTYSVQDCQEDETPDGQLIEKRARYEAVRIMDERGGDHCYFMKGDVQHRETFARWKNVERARVRPYKERSAFLKRGGFRKVRPARSSPNKQCATWTSKVARGDYLFGVEIRQRARALARLEFEADIARKPKAKTWFLAAAQLVVVWVKIPSYVGAHGAGESERDIEKTMDLRVLHVGSHPELAVCWE